MRATRIIFNNYRHSIPNTVKSEIRSTSKPAPKRSAEALSPLTDESINTTLESQYLRGQLSIQQVNPSETDTAPAAPEKPDFKLIQNIPGLRFQSPHVTQSDFDSFAAELFKSKHPLIVGHRAPDEDCVGSALALKNVLNHQGKPATVWFKEPVAKRFPYIPGTETVQKWLPRNAFDLLVSVDVSDKDRFTGSAIIAGVYPDIPLITMDHHATAAGDGYLNVVDPDISSNAQLLYHFFQSQNWDVPKDAAADIYAGMVGDTGGFKYKAVTPETHQVAAELLRKGIEHEEIADGVLDTRDDYYFKTILQAGQNMEVNRDLGYVITVVENGSAKDAVEHIRKLKGTQVHIAFAVSPKKGVVRASLRSKNDFDVSKLAQEFGGGGHRQAAGLFFEGKLEDVKPRVIEALKRQMAESQDSEMKLAA